MTYNYEEVAALIGRSTRQVQRLVKSGKFPKPLPKRSFEGSTSPNRWDAKLIDELVKAQS